MILLSYSSYFKRRSSDVEVADGGLTSLFLPFVDEGKSFNSPLQTRDVRKRQTVGAFPLNFLFHLRLGSRWDKEQ